jgi:transcriptional regulator of arginine metabolism
MKGKRQSLILQIIADKDIETQEQLLLELHASGIEATQATISRDIKELHLVKEPNTSGTYRYLISEKKNSISWSVKLRTIFKEGVTSFDVAQNIVVVKTIPGLAPAAGAALDNMELPDMVGSLAGDDTVILIMRNNDAAEELCREINKILKS